MWRPIIGEHRARTDKNVVVERDIGIDGHVVPNVDPVADRHPGINEHFLAEHVGTIPVRAGRRHRSERGDEGEADRSGGGAENRPNRSRAERKINP